MENNATEETQLQAVLTNWKKVAGHELPVIFHLSTPLAISSSSKKIVVRKIPVDIYQVKYHNADNFYKPVSRMI